MVSSEPARKHSRGFGFWFPLGLAGILAAVLLPALLILPLAQVLTSPAAVAEAERKLQPLPFDEAGTRYSTTPAMGPVEELAQRLDRGEQRLAPGDYGYLPAVLQALHVPKASQILVFSKTSSDKVHISPRTPRAIYFNDHVSVQLPDLFHGIR